MQGIAFPADDVMPRGFEETLKFLFFESFYVVRSVLSDALFFILYDQYPLFGLLLLTHTYVTHPCFFSSFDVSVEAAWLCFCRNILIFFFFFLGSPDAVGYL